MKLNVLLFFVLFIQLNGFNQIVTTDPEYPTQDALCIVYFDATGTDLQGYTGDVYAHTGVTVNGTQWQYVISDWNTNIDKAKLTNIGIDIYQLDITPTIREYYEVLDSLDIISEMCFVFRSSDGGTQTHPDIFIDVYGSELIVVIQKPELSGFLVELNEPIEVMATSPLADSMFLYVNDVEVKAIADIVLNDTILADNFGSYWTEQWVKVMAKNETDMVVDSFSYIVIPESPVAELPEGIIDGINYIDESTVILSLYAPEKNYVFVVGDFNDWEVGEANYMNKTPDGDRYWIQLDNLTAGEEYAYQYFIDGTIKIGDPYCEKVLDPWNDQYISEETYPNLKPYPTGKGDGIVSVLQTNQEEYEWQTTGFEPPAITDLVIYELLIRDFTDAHDFKTMKDTINYFKRLGINAIELMPVNEFEWNLSWGYNPSFYFAPDKYYGPKEDLKVFIDECHSNGIAVIFDIVLNHAYGQNVMAQMYWDSENNQPAANNPWFNTVSPNPDYHWGNDFNHESPDTKAFVDRVNRYWMSEYKFDGFRFDFTKGFTNTPGNGWNYDPARIAILKRMADSIWAYNPDAYVILEHFADNNEEKELANYGMMLWGNMNYNYCEASMGWTSNSDFSWASYQSRDWNNPNLVAYMESHDEERMMYKNITWGNSTTGYNIKDTTIALQRIPLAAAFYFTLPGPKMIWQFEELGYDYTIDYNGRTGEKPIRWDYFNDYRRKLVYNLFSELIKLKKNFETFKTTDYSISVSGAMKRINLNHASMNVTVIGNFSVEENSIIPNFQHTGMWYDYFYGDSINVTSVTETISLSRGEFKIYTDVKLETPQIGLGVDNPVISEENMSLVYPNPSAGYFNISFIVRSESHVKITLYNINGKIVKSLTSEKFNKGEHVINWDGSNDS
ncbi:MAG: T9SS type A sorting domain-containing protein, partial [Bacteroidales bacterium]|nr:T9SS type A sorting domain-containing protein [Bacteroidales bacterium]